MKPHKPSNRLKAERVQGRILAIGKSFVTRLFEALEWIETTARKLKEVFVRRDNDRS